MSRVLAIKISLGILVIFLSSVFILFLKGDSRVYLNFQPLPSYRQKGSDVDAKVVIYEFSDLSCPACERSHFYLKNLLDYFPYVKVNFKHYPLTNIHPYAFKAAVWAECAGMKYSKFWEFVDLLFMNRQKWSNSQDHERFFEEYSRELLMNVSVMRDCVERSQAADLVKSDMDEGDRIGVDSTPTFFVNGKKAVGGAELVERLKEVIK